MGNNIVINFEKTGRPIEDFLKAFSEQKTISIEVMQDSSNTPEITIKVGIFINSWLWENEKKCKLIFTTLFKSEGMIPGLYKLDIERKDFQENNQAWAYLLPIN